MQLFFILPFYGTDGCIAPAVGGSVGGTGGGGHDGGFVGGGGGGDDCVVVIIVQPSCQMHMSENIAISVYAQPCYRHSTNVFYTQSTDLYSAPTNSRKLNEHH